MCIGLHVKCPLFLSDLMKLELSGQILKNTEINFHENSSSRGPCRQTDGRTDRQMDRHNEANSRFSQFCEHCSNEKCSVLEFIELASYLSGYFPLQTLKCIPLFLYSYHILHQVSLRFQYNDMCCMSLTTDIS